MPNSHTDADTEHTSLEPPPPKPQASTSERSGISRRGFASMDEQTQRMIASKGGHSQGRANNPGNFANNRERARAAGRKGGEAHGSYRNS
jgi:general stress protein YciG